MDGIDFDGMLATTTALRARLADARLPLATEQVEGARRTAVHVRRQLDDYVLPRLRDIDAPVLAVVGGSTGAGKSTLVNSLVGAEVTRPGVLRPTTRSPVLVHHPSAARWFDGRPGPRLARPRAWRRDRRRRAPTSCSWWRRDAVPRRRWRCSTRPTSTRCVDANRELAAQLLDAADLWVFVTTAARYADAVPWEFLRSASRRGVGIGLVLNRVPPGAADEIAPHLASMLRRRGPRRGSAVRARGAAAERRAAAGRMRCARCGRGSARLAADRRGPGRAGPAHSLAGRGGDAGGAGPSEVAAAIETRSSTPPAGSPASPPVPSTEAATSGWLTTSATAR